MCLLRLPESLLEREGVLYDGTSAKARNSFLNSAHEVAWGAGAVHHVVDLLALSHHLCLGCLPSRQLPHIIHRRNEVVNNIEVHFVPHSLIILDSAVISDRVGVYLCGVMRLELLLGLHIATLSLFVRIGSALVSKSFCL